MADPNLVGSVMIIEYLSMTTMVTTTERLADSMTERQKSV